MSIVLPVGKPPVSNQWSNNLIKKDCDLKIDVPSPRPLPGTSQESVSRYKNDRVIAYYVQTYGWTKQQALLLRRQLMDFLWTVRAEKRNTLHDEAVDQIYHTFLLFTKDYREFCCRYFWAFIDHLP